MSLLRGTAAHSGPVVMQVLVMSSVTKGHSTIQKRNRVAITRTCFILLTINLSLSWLKNKYAMYFCKENRTYIKQLIILMLALVCKRKVLLCIIYSQQVNRTNIKYLFCG